MADKTTVIDVPVADGMDMQASELLAERSLYVQNFDLHQGVLTKRTPFVELDNDAQRLEPGTSIDTTPNIDNIVGMATTPRGNLLVATHENILQYDPRGAHGQNLQNPWQDVDRVVLPVSDAFHGRRHQRYSGFVEPGPYVSQTGCDCAVFEWQGGRYLAMSFSHQVEGAAYGAVEIYSLGGTSGASEDPVVGYEGARELVRQESFAIEATSPVKLAAFTVGATGYVHAFYVRGTTLYSRRIDMTSSTLGAEVSVKTNAKPYAFDVSDVHTNSSVDYCWIICGDSSSLLNMMVGRWSNAQALSPSITVTAAAGTTVRKVGIAHAERSSGAIVAIIFATTTFLYAGRYTDSTLALATAPFVVQDFATTTYEPNSGQIAICECDDAQHGAALHCFATYNDAAPQRAMVYRWIFDTSPVTSLVTMDYWVGCVLAHKPRALVTIEDSYRTVLVGLIRIEETETDSAFVTADSWTMRGVGYCAPLSAAFACYQESDATRNAQALSRFVYFPNDANPPYFAPFYWVGFTTARPAMDTRLTCFMLGGSIAQSFSVAGIDEEPWIAASVTSIARGPNRGLTDGPDPAAGAVGPIPWFFPLLTDTWAPAPE